MDDLVRKDALKIIERVIEILKVKDEKDGYYIINESDFDKEKHELFDQVKAEKEGSVPWLKQELDQMGIKYSDSDKKTDLKSLYDSNVEK